MSAAAEASLQLPLLSRSTNSSYHYHHPGFLVNKKMTPGLPGIPSVCFYSEEVKKKGLASLANPFL
jgi:hypothetical protein